MVPSDIVDDVTEKGGVLAKPSMFLTYTQEPIALPQIAIPINSSEVPDAAKEYLLSRNFSPDTLYRVHHILYSPEGTGYELPGGAVRALKYSRIIIPIIQSRRVVAWQGRIIGECPVGAKKYLFSTGFKKSLTLYNKDNAMLCDDIIIVEGVTDVWRIGAQGVALFGKTISQRQIEIMAALWGYNGRAVLLLDSDAKASSEAVFKRLLEAQVFPRGIGYVELQGNEDPASMSLSELRNKISSAKFYNKKVGG